MTDLTARKPILDLVAEAVAAGASQLRLRRVAPGAKLVTINISGVRISPARVRSQSITR